GLNAVLISSSVSMLSVLNNVFDEIKCREKGSMEGPQDLAVN
ncbi:hypothetical protein A2U01_0107089, partial [Trifolium medium]|nr:hypothetical protein [Trifolium medium]